MLELCVLGSGCVLWMDSKRHGCSCEGNSSTFVNSYTAHIPPRCPLPDRRILTDGRAMQRALRGYARQAGGRRRRYPRQRFED